VDFERSADDDDELAVQLSSTYKSMNDTVSVSSRCCCCRRDTSVNSGKGKGNADLNSAYT